MPLRLHALILFGTAIRRKLKLTALSAAALHFGLQASAAFGVLDMNGMEGGSRWDAAPRVIGGQERSLEGGLRYTVQGGSWQAYRDLISWNGTPPSVAVFEQAVREAFAFWTSADPATGLGTTVQFLPDFGTAASTGLVDNVRQGAEIDLLVSTDGASWDPNSNATRAETVFNSVTVPGNLTLTSGTANYAGLAITGADITFNNNPQAKYTFTVFRTLLTHEIGHALGLTDVDVVSGPIGEFIDDNYSSADPLATLTNSFALKINPLNPAASPLTKYTVANGVPGLDTTGVDILMESSIPLGFYGPGLKLTNDEYAGRQFLYPVFPPAPPVLLISREGNECVLRWENRTVWSLQTSTELSSGWTNTPNQGTAAGSLREWRGPFSMPRQFFRLKL